MYAPRLAKLVDDSDLHMTPRISQCFRIQDLCSFILVYFDKLKNAKRLQADRQTDWQTDRSVDNRIGLQEAEREVDGQVDWRTHEWDQTD